MDSTTLIPPRFVAVVDEQGNLRITPTGHASDPMPRSAVEPIEVRAT
jgi:hypothetical protein